MNEVNFFDILIDFNPDSLTSRSESDPFAEICNEVYKQPLVLLKMRQISFGFAQ